MNYSDLKKGQTYTYNGFGSKVGKKYELTRVATNYCTLKAVPGQPGMSRIDNEPFPIGTQDLLDGINGPDKDYILNPQE